MQDLGEIRLDGGIHCSSWKIDLTTPSYLVKLALGPRKDDGGLIAADSGSRRLIFKIKLFFVLYLQLL